MKVLSLENASVRSPAIQLARLSGTHGYRLDGDTVRLNAMFAILDSGAHQCSWALQLWACDSTPASATGLAGHIVAEVSLPPMSELADETEHYEVTAFACPPAGRGEYIMALVLASGAPGQYDQIHDIAVYPRPQQFIQPVMIGNAGYKMDGAAVHLSVDRIDNPRPEGNRSGALSLELWALSDTFIGGSFNGHHLAGLELGQINGQDSVTPQPIALAFNAPPAGTWQIVLMLREWTARGPVTRDFTNFPAPFVSAPVENKSAPLVIQKPAPTAPEKPVASVVAPASTPVPSKSAAPVAAQSPVPAPPKLTGPAVAQPSVSAATVSTKPAPPVVASKPEAVKAPAPVAPIASVAPAAPSTAKDPSSKCVSINTATAEELAAVKGLSSKLAKSIVKKRPFASLDDLRQIKGIGAEILAKIRSSLKL